MANKLNFTETPHQLLHDMHDTNKDFQMFTHKKKKRVQELGNLTDDLPFDAEENIYQTISENYHTLKEALLELYLSVKIRSDEEIDNYTEEQFKKEKE